METALKDNAKIVVPTGSDLVNVLGEMAGIIPLRAAKDPYDSYKPDPKPL
jgi:hypothetical protein